MFEGQFRLWKSTSGNLGCYHNGKRREYIPLEKDIFRNKENPTQYIVFTRNAEGQIKNMYRNFVLGGFQVPASYRKAGWFERPRFLNDEYPVLLMIFPSYLLLPILWLITYFIRRKRNPQFLMTTAIPGYYHAAALLFLGLFFFQVMGFWIPLFQDRQQLFLGLSPALYSMRYFNYAMAGISVILVLLSFFQWQRGHGNLWIRIYYTLYSVIIIPQSGFKISIPVYNLRENRSCIIHITLYTI